MSENWHVTAHEHGVVRVLRVADDADPAFAESEALRRSLDAQALAMEKIEVISTSKIKPLGLTQYLIDGYGVAEAEVEDDRRKLDSIDGKVVILPSSAFGNTAQTLTPQAPLEPLGVYREQGSAPHATSKPHASARGTAAGVPPETDAAPSGGKPRSGSILLYLVIAAAVVLVGAFLIG